MSYLAIDCEMVGSGSNACLGRVSIVNEDCRVIYDTYVKPTLPVTDYRTQYSGLSQSKMSNGKNFNDVQREVKDLLRGKVVVGHDLDHDFRALGFSHPNVRDTATYRKFIAMNNGNKPSLKFLASRILGKNIQMGGHDSAEDAKAVMEVFKTVKNEW